MKMLLLVSMLLLFSCAGSSLPDMPRGAVAGCIDIEYTGTVTKSKTEARLLFLSQEQASRIQTVQDAVDLANALGCPVNRG